MDDALQRLADDAHAKVTEILQRAKPIDTCPECGEPIEPTRQALVDELATHGYRMYERDGQGWVVEPIMEEVAD